MHPSHVVLPGAVAEQSDNLALVGCDVPIHTILQTGLLQVGSEFQKQTVSLLVESNNWGCPLHADLAIILCDIIIVMEENYENE